MCSGCHGWPIFFRSWRQVTRAGATGAAPRTRSIAPAPPRPPARSGSSRSAMPTRTAPPGTSTATVAVRRSVDASTTAATATVPVPQDRVSPTPRSCTRMATRSATEHRHELDVHPVREDCRVEPGRAAQVERGQRRTSVRQTRCGLPTSTATPANCRSPASRRRPGRRAAPGPSRSVTSPVVRHIRRSGRRRGWRTVSRPGRRQPGVDQVAGEHPDAVAAHLGDRAVGVAVVHERSRPRRRPRRARPG